MTRAHTNCLCCRKTTNKAQDIDTSTAATTYNAPKHKHGLSVVKLLIPKPRKIQSSNLTQNVAQNLAVGLPRSNGFPSGTLPVDDIFATWRAK